MNAPTYQTVRLAKGRHSGPDQGACVMELASMLAGEPFSDQPRSVCPVIATVLRTYNDRVDDERRQRLYLFASVSVGTRGPRATAALRTRVCEQWIKQQMTRRRRRGLRGRLSPSSIEVAVDPPAVVAGRVAARGVMRGKLGAEEALRALIERLVACGSEAASTTNAVHEPAATSCPG